MIVQHSVSRWLKYGSSLIEAFSFAMPLEEAQPWRTCSVCGVLEPFAKPPFDSDECCANHEPPRECVFDGAVCPAGELCLSNIGLHESLITVAQRYAAMHGVQ